MTGIMKRDNNGRMAPMSLGGFVDQLFEKNLSRFFDDSFWGFDSSRGLTAGQVPVNVKETDQTYEMELVAPGLNKEDFKVNVQGDMLTIAFGHRDEQRQENKDEGWLRREFRMQSFSRSFSLDDSVDTGKITATYSDGVLRLTLPKKEHARRLTRNIEIQ